MGTMEQWNFGMMGLAEKSLSIGNVVRIDYHKNWK
jgi:hypothetical protein